MDSLLNKSRPPVFCPGCSHDKVVHALDRAFREMGLAGQDIAIVSDIGCSGLFDTFFNTHAFHGLHGRALTYATGIKMAKPDLHVVVTMGDGGMGIGGAHLLSTCRRNIGITLLVLNNFNYGMTGGQCSATTPQEAEVGSGFLNHLEKPVDICMVAGSAGAGCVARVSTYDRELVEKLKAAIRYDGFSLVDIWGICPGRYTRRNKLSPADIQTKLDRLPSLEHFVDVNARDEYGRNYREKTTGLTPAPPAVCIEVEHSAPGKGRQEVVILGSAGQRIITAGEILCLAGATAGLHATQKNDYPITVMRGHSVSEMILSDEEVGYTGIDSPGVVIALAQEGVERRKKMLQQLPGNAIILKARDVELPVEKTAETIDFKAMKIKPPDRALASLAILASKNHVLSLEMLRSALALRFNGETLNAAMSVVNAAAENFSANR
jgi:pyruvate/2-oxoacid:ferredoxin oxidoreductase beta subunit/Pyruvate/2-oxoacid:ferredoxin oxidoreductase gamma subunit